MYVSLRAYNISWTQLKMHMKEYASKTYYLHTIYGTEMHDRIVPIDQMKNY